MLGTQGNSADTILMALSVLNASIVRRKFKRSWQELSGPMMFIYAKAQVWSVLVKYPEFWSTASNPCHVFQVH